MHDLTARPSNFRRPLVHWAPLSAVAWLGLQAGLARAQTPLEPAPMVLRSSPMLQQKITPPPAGGLPTFVEGDLITGRTDLETLIEGNAMLRRGDSHSFELARDKTPTLGRNRSLFDEIFGNIGAVGAGGMGGNAGGSGPGGGPNGS